MVVLMEVVEIKETMATKDDVRLILNRIDSFVQRSETIDRKWPVHGRRLDETEAKISDHEARLSSLEKK